MKALFSTVLVLIATAQTANAATGQRSGDYLIVVAPAIFVSVVAISHVLREEYNEWKKRKQEQAANSDIGENRMPQF